MNIDAEHNINVDEMIDCIGDAGWSISYKKSSANNMVNYHNHEIYEMYCLISGKRILFVDNKEIMMSAGSVVVIAPGTHHKFLKAELKEEYSCLIVYFKKNILPKIFFDDKNYRDLLFDKYFEACENEEITDFVDEIAYDVMQKDELYKMIVHGKIFQLIASVMKNNNSMQLSPKEALEKENILELVRIYIDKNLNKALSLDLLSNKFFLSSPYLSKKFKNEYSVKISDYIVERRVQKVIWMMHRMGKYDIDKYIKECGFTSRSNFFRIFKNITGQSPKAYFKQINSDTTS